MHENDSSDQTHLAPLHSRILAALINASAALITFAGTAIACKELLMRGFPPMLTLLAYVEHPHYLFQSERIENDRFEIVMAIGMIGVSLLLAQLMTKAVHGFTSGLTQRTLLQSYATKQPEA
ncbi:hypothetical protein JWH16_04585 [Xanthomonas campestris pv. campestris]|uniref:hypothetical protein n=1 Tax=Xanthomonas campestris TaxID=339 RepID=UPI001E446123|nr:hypothetical protein [Xanthomonas campestris]MCD0253132.1 hypothetical protein [Xanthomonas campestris pv. campestris]